MTAIVTGWMATAHHGDEFPSVLTIQVRDFEGANHIDVATGDGDPYDPGIGIWHETQLGELIAGLLAAAKQAGYSLDVVRSIIGDELQNPGG